MHSELIPNGIDVEFSYVENSKNQFIIWTSFLLSGQYFQTLYNPQKKNALEMLTETETKRKFIQN